MLVLAMTELEKRLRTMTLPQLQALQLIAKSPDGISTTKELSDTTQTASYTLGAFITSLLKIKTEKGRLLLPAGRDIDAGMRWKINENVMRRRDLQKLLKSILD